MRAVSPVFNEQRSQRPETRTVSSGTVDPARVGTSPDQRHTARTYRRSRLSAYASPAYPGLLLGFGIPMMTGVGERACSEHRLGAIVVRGMTVEGALGDQLLRRRRQPHRSREVHRPAPRTDRRQLLATGGTVVGASRPLFIHRAAGTPEPVDKGSDAAHVPIVHPPTGVCLLLSRWHGSDGE